MQEPNERPALTVAATEEIMRATVMFVDKMRELYGIKGLTLCLAMDVGQGRIAMKPIHTGVNTLEARHMVAYQLQHLDQALNENEQRQEPKNIN